MEKKYSLNRKTSPEGHLQSESEISTFKNENVVFKIHTAKGQQSYNAKTFPAKFSINICNQQNQLGSGFYNRAPIQSLTNSQQYIPLNKKQIQNMKTLQRSQSNFDLQQYQKQLKIIYEDKKKCDVLIMQLQETCQQYERQNQDYRACLNQKCIKIQELQQKLHMKDRNQIQNRQNAYKKDVQIRQLKQKVKSHQNELSKLKQMLNSVQKQHQIDMQKLQAHIAELQQVINQKEQTIKKLSNFNNEITKKVIDQHCSNSNSHVKQMQKWLKTINKKCQHTHNDKNGKENQMNRRNQYIVTELLNKSQGMSDKIMQLEKLVHYLDVQLKKVYLENEGLLQKNEQLKKSIHELQTALQQKEGERYTQQSFFRRTLSSTISQQQQGGIIYEGTVKVKMERLLVEKDKRINSLESELLDAKKQNTMLRSKLYQLDCQQQMNFSLRSSDQFSIKRARSVGSFHLQKPQNIIKKQSFQSQQQIAQIMSQCNNLTQTLGSFLQACKTQRPVQQSRKLRLSEALYSNQQQAQSMQKVKQLMRLQKQTLSFLQKNMKKSQNTFQQAKSNYNREAFLCKTDRDKNTAFPFNNDPITQRIYKPDIFVRRTERSQKSCYFN